MKNTAIAKVFQDIGDLLELKGENQFKIRAYQRAARVIEHLPTEIEFIIKEGGNLQDIPGVGEAIAKKIQELVTTGKLEYYEKLRAEFPEGISTLLDIPGVGPKTAMRLSSELGVRTVDDLEKAIREGQVAALFRLGDKTAENLLHSIQALRRKDQRIPIGEALPLVDDMMEALRPIPGLRNLTTAGSLRRFRESIGDIDLMGTADDPDRVIDAFAGLPQVKEVLAKGSTKASVLVAGGLQVDLRLVEHDRFGSLLQYFTGSKQHNIALRDRFSRRGLKLSEYGITDEATGQTALFPTEEAFYQRLGLQYVPPEIREDTGEVELAEQGLLPRLIEPADIRGDLHIHTNWSDGHNSIEEMAIAARELGYEYLAITDHSAGRGAARGLDQERLLQQVEEIKELNQRLQGIRLLSGIELDIRADGSLDFPDELLAQLDIVVASVHSSMGQEEAKMTRRILGALENPHIHVLAHPTCRLLGEREPVAADWEVIFKKAVETGTALEINAMPTRLDLKDIHIRRARELGAKLVMGTDAHSPAQFQFMRFGIGIARRGWCRAEDVLNTRPLTEVLASLKKG
ncbi:MAG TPA: DNA polymerase/3'-5' exonuclease PolX [Dehalococcoidia bacterium]|nr:DNA polymerase/3'-5' exonuclease PolX [Dehalococcoidia bacterium]